MKRAGGGKWHAYLTHHREVRVAEYAEPQPWGQATRKAALRVFRPAVQSLEKTKRQEADDYAAALDAIDALLEES